MNSKERIRNILNGKPVDRIPVYTQIPFAVDKYGFKPAAFHGYEDHDDWRECDPEYWKLVRRMEKECDNFFVWRPSCMRTDPFFIPTSMVTELPSVNENGRIETTQIFESGKLKLTQRKAVQPGSGHSWQLDHFCKSAMDASALLEIPWEKSIPDMEDFYTNEKLLGDKGAIWVTVPSPLLIVCRLFDPSTFLMMALDEKSLIDKLMSTAYERIHTNLEFLLKAGAGPIIRFGGAEHATPPMMSPHDFDWLVVDYDKPLMDLCKKFNCKVAVHCHGQISHALKRFVEMGVDQTDPVETLPDGDMTITEAREIAKDKIVLTGNIQMRELYSCNPDEIEQRVKQLIDEMKPDRLIITSTGTPLERMTPVLAKNYNRMIDSALEYGSIRE